MQQQTPYIYPGAIHIHTTFSDGSGKVPDVVAAARQAGLRWIIITDHDTLGARESEGWHDDLLVIVGHEITPVHNHFLALNLTEVVRPSQDAQRFLDEVYQRGGFGIIAHPDDHYEDRTKGGHYWTDWEVNRPNPPDGQSFGPVGIEVWNLMSDWRSNDIPDSRDLELTTTGLDLRGPTANVLAWWDGLNMAGQRTFGTGGLDAHAWRRFRLDGGFTIFPYEWMFGTITNYLLLDAPLKEEAQEATAQVLAALQQGRNYLVNRLDGTPPAPPLLARRDGEAWQIGASPSLAGGPLRLQAAAGNTAELRLIHNGALLARGTGSLDAQIDQPGVYRLEGRHDGRGWLFTNPIFVQP